MELACGVVSPALASCLAGAVSLAFDTASVSCQLEAADGSDGWFSWRLRSSRWATRSPAHHITALLAIWVRTGYVDKSLPYARHISGNLLASECRPRRATRRLVAGGKLILSSSTFNPKVSSSPAAPGASDLRPIPPGPMIVAAAICCGSLATTKRLTMKTVTDGAWISIHCLQHEPVRKSSLQALVVASATYGWVGGLA
jgi:hypothetical protein